MMRRKLEPAAKTAGGRGGPPGDMIEALMAAPNPERTPRITRAQFEAAVAVLVRAGNYESKQDLARAMFAAAGVEVEE